MYGLNRVEIIGRLGTEPEVRTTTTGKPVTSFRVAVNSRGGDGETTEWFSVVAWERLAEVCHEYLHKGDLVYIAGRMQSRRYTDRDGVDRIAHEVVAREMLMLGGKRDGEPAAPRSPGRAGTSAATNTSTAGPVDLDEVPF